LRWTERETADLESAGGLPKPAWRWPGDWDVDSPFLALLLREAGPVRAADALARLDVDRATHDAVTGALGLQLHAERPSEVVAQLDPLGLRAAAAAYVARPEARERLDAYLSRWRHIRAKMTGDDLAALGLAPGPEFRRILGRLRAARLDGEVDEAGEAALARALAGLE
jgi:hypothetical protein